ncbi:MAG: hypothetical protein LQ350_005077 [Teloschistes chrysophthalmus]|nr:MAG: hypothetical protein LQ350_005077 [Niorma chrysophthalma]
MGTGGEKAGLILNGTAFRYDFGLPTLAAGPDYYKRAHFRSPTEDTDTPFQQAFNTDLGNEVPSGGEGYYIKTFLKKFPHAPGRMVLQDIHQAKETEELRMGFESMKYNFFDPQPIRGARIYYSHFVFTDWADPHCRRILRNTAPAMTPGYSKLIINDVILPDTGCHWQHAALDMIMMSTLSGIYRTKGDFRTPSG